jgi:hypothetical protein
LGLGAAGNLHAEDWISSPPGAASAESSNDTQAPSTPSPLAGTAPLTMTGDLASQMVDGIHRFLLRRRKRRRKNEGTFGSETIARQRIITAPSRPTASASARSSGQWTHGLRPWLPNWWGPYRRPPRFRRGQATKFMPYGGRCAIR